MGQWQFLKAGLQQTIASDLHQDILFIQYLKINEENVLSAAKLQEEQSRSD